MPENKKNGREAPLRVPLDFDEAVKLAVKVKPPTPAPKKKKKQKRKINGKTPKGAER